MVTIGDYEFKEDRHYSEDHIWIKAEGNGESTMGLDPMGLAIAGNVSMIRVKKAGKSLFREFIIPPPFQSAKDIFCLRAKRRVNQYRKISFNSLELSISGVPIRELVQLRIVPDKESGLAEVRLWYKEKLVGIQKVKNEDLNLVHF